MLFYSTKHLLTSIHKNYFNIFEGGQATINTDSHDNLCVRNNFPRITLRWHNTVLGELLDPVTNLLRCNFLTHSHFCRHKTTMKPSIVADEMFPEGAGPYMDIEEVSLNGHT